MNFLRFLKCTTILAFLRTIRRVAALPVRMVNRRKDILLPYEVDILLTAYDSNDDVYPYAFAKLEKNDNPDSRLTLDTFYRRFKRLERRILGETQAGTRSGSKPSTP